MNAKITAFRAERGKVGRDVWNGIPAVRYELEYGGGRFLRNVGTYLRKYMAYSGTVLCYYLSKLQRQGISRKKVRCLSKFDATHLDIRKPNTANTVGHRLFILFTNTKFVSREITAVYCDNPAKVTITDSG